MNGSRIAAALAALTLIWGAAATSEAGTAVYDTSFTLESSYACLGGGCHETNAELLADYAAASMTHVLVKCNACHGTHTAAEVGHPKPNLTGAKAGMGTGGYAVGKDRCLVCHMEAAVSRGHPKNPGECVACHAPHLFRARR